MSQKYWFLLNYAIIWKIFGRLVRFCSAVFTVFAWKCCKPWAILGCRARAVELVRTELGRWLRIRLAEPAAHPSVMSVFVYLIRTIRAICVCFPMFSRFLYFTSFSWSKIKKMKWNFVVSRIIGNFATETKTLFLDCGRKTTNPGKIGKRNEAANEVIIPWEILGYKDFLFIFLSFIESFVSLHYKRWKIMSDSSCFVS